jgi:hypothetical protein
VTIGNKTHTSACLLLYLFLLVLFHCSIGYDGRISLITSKSLEYIWVPMIHRLICVLMHKDTMIGKITKSFLSKSLLENNTTFWPLGNMVVQPRQLLKKYPQPFRKKMTIMIAAITTFFRRTARHPCQRRRTDVNDGEMM